MSRSVKVRIALVVNSDGKWNASGWSGAENDEVMECALEGLEATGGEAEFWITATVPLPEVQEIAGAVEEVEEPEILTRGNS